MIKIVWQYSHKQGAEIFQIADMTLVRRAGERQIAIFQHGKCIETINSVTGAAEFLSQRA